MANREQQLISRIIHTGNLGAVMDWGITHQDFLTNEARAMFDHILGYYSTAGTAGAVPGPEAIQQMYVGLARCDDPGMTTPALCTEVRKSRLAIETINKMDQVRVMIEKDPILGLTALQGHVTDLVNIGLGKNTDVMLGDAISRINVRYEMLKSGIDLSVGKWPWQIMNDVTGGLQPDDYIVFFGRPKAFKSWMLAYFIACIFNSGKRGLIYTKEMTPDNIFQRTLACIAEIEYSGLRLGKLSEEEEHQLYAVSGYIQAAQTGNRLVCLSGQDAPEGGDTVPWLQSKVEKYNPDIIFIDGMYLMSDSRNAQKEHQRVKNISRALRQMNLQLKKPLICTLQANRAAAKNKEANLDEISFSDAIGQDATCIIRVINEKDSPTCQLVLGGSREFQLNGFRTYAIPATSFEYYGPLSSEEIDKATQEDGKPEDNPDAHAKKRKRTSEGLAAKSLVSAINKTL